MSCKSDYIERIGNEHGHTEYAFLVDIAWSLHNIAAMLMEQNGYVYPYECLEGKDVNGGDDDECVSE